MSPLEELREELATSRRAISTSLSTLLPKYPDEKDPAGTEKSIAVNGSVRHLFMNFSESLRLLDRGTRESVQMFIQSSIPNTLKSLNSIVQKHGLTDPEFEQLTQQMHHMAEVGATTLDKLGGPNPILGLRLAIHQQKKPLRGVFDSFPQRIFGAEVSEEQKSKFLRGCSAIQDCIPLTDEIEERSPKELLDLFVEKRASLERLTTKYGFPLTETRYAEAFSPYTQMLDHCIALCEETVRGQGWSKDKKD